MEVTILARNIRAGSAPTYCGMSRAVFDEEIKPYLVTIPIGKQGIAYDRFDLDAALDEYKQRRGRAPARTWSKEEWQQPNHVGASVSGRVSGTSTNESTVRDFAAAAARATGRKPKGT